MLNRLIYLVLVLCVSACGREQAPAETEGPTPPEPLTAATLGEQQLLSNTEFLALEPYATADKEKGRRQAQICLACHTLEAGGPSRVGPNLHGFFGSKVGVSPEFSYSAAILEADFMWTPRALDAWLAYPSKFLPGNRMSFPGVRDATDRANLIAFLLDVTDDDSE